MIYGVVHRVSQGILARIEAKNINELKQKFVDDNPDYCCDTWSEFLMWYPVLASNLSFILLN